jgi:hypothetical protein
MAFSKSKKNLHEINESANISWNQLLTKANMLLAEYAEYKVRSAKLRAAIKYFETQKKAGVPFPVSDNTTTQN